MGSGRFDLFLRWPADIETSRWLAGDARHGRDQQDGERLSDGAGAGGDLLRAGGGIHLSGPRPRISQPSNHARSQSHRHAVVRRANRDALPARQSGRGALRSSPIHRMLSCRSPRPPVGCCSRSRCSASASPSTAPASCGIEASVIAPRRHIAATALSR
jgi:hypothetical protein